MATCDPVDLAGSGCWNCLTPDQKMNAELSLLCQILQALDPMAECDPLTLAGDGCANCLMPNQKTTVLWSLSCSILEAMGGLGGGSVYGGNGSPEGVQVATAPAIYIQYDAPGVVWSKITGSGNTGWAMNS